MLKSEEVLLDIKLINRGEVSGWSHGWSLKFVIWADNHVIRPWLLYTLRTKLNLRQKSCLFFSCLEIA